MVVLLPALREEAAPTPGRCRLPGSAGPLPGAPLRMVRGDCRGSRGLEAGKAYSPSIEKYITSVYLSKYIIPTNISAQI